MTNDRAVGGGIFGGGIAGIIIYGALLWFAPQLTLQVTAFLAVAVLLGILAWIGYTMATTPPPEPITDVPQPEPEPKAGSKPEDKPASTS